VRGEVNRCQYVPIGAEVALLRRCQGERRNPQGVAAKRICGTRASGAIPGARSVPVPAWRGGAAFGPARQAGVRTQTTRFNLAQRASVTSNDESNSNNVFNTSCDLAETSCQRSLNCAKVRIGTMPARASFESAGGGAGLDKRAKGGAWVHSFRGGSVALAVAPRAVERVGAEGLEEAGRLGERDRAIYEGARVKPSPVRC
jgi:hypothetical protein